MAIDLLCDPRLHRRPGVESPDMRLLFCGSGWLPIVDLIAARLPSGATITAWDRRTPLANAVSSTVFPPPDSILKSQVALATKTCFEP